MRTTDHQTNLYLLTPPRRQYLIAAWLFLGHPGWAQADAKTFPDLRRDAAEWLGHQVDQTYPDALHQVELGPLDTRLRLGPCGEIRFFLPPGARLWSGGSLGMQCVAPSRWTLYLTYQVQLTGPALTTSRPIPARALLEAGDVTMANTRYDQDPGGYLRELPQGATTLRPMNANQPILVFDLALPDTVKAGTKVRVRIQGRGFSVSQEGKALNSARAGAQVQVKMPSGRIVRGMANQAGEVEVGP